MYTFNGTELARERAQILSTQIEALPSQIEVKIASILFYEDAGSRLYAGVKREQAKNMGIEYELYTFSLTDTFEAIASTIQALNNDKSVAGIIIQKPWRKTWLEHHSSDDKLSYDEWWNQLYSMVDPKKDVDGLHPETIEAIQQNTWQETSKVLPATCQAVLDILDTAAKYIPSQAKVIIIGKSDLLGIPLYHILNNRGQEVELLGKKELQHRIESGRALTDAQVIISATGVSGLITGEMISEGVVLIDVGEPKADIDVASVSQKAAFLTPVPGGVGPLTVICLMENAYRLATRSL